MVLTVMLSEWAVEGCGGILTKPSGILESPNYPNIYPSNVECLWYITTSLGQSIELNIEDFYIEGDRCQWDFLAVYGGPDDSSPELTRLCNRRSQNTTVTSQVRQYTRILFLFFGYDDLRTI